MVLSNDTDIRFAPSFETDQVDPNWLSTKRIRRTRNQILGIPNYPIMADRSLILKAHLDSSQQLPPHTYSLANRARKYSIGRLPFNELQCPQSSCKLSR